jgi:hypothetical protein
MLPDKQTAGATKPTSTSPTKAAFPSVDEAVADALKQVAGPGAAKESATDDTEQPEDETTGEETQDETTEGDDTESEGEEDESGEDETSDELLTLDDVEDMRPGEVMSLSLKRVKPEDHAAVRLLKSQLSRQAQALAEDRRRREGETNTDTKPEKKQQEKSLSRDELYEMAMEGPEGFDRALDLALEQRLDAALAKRNIKAPSEQEQQAELIDDAIQGAIENKYAELADPKFRKAVAAELAEDAVLGRRMENALKAKDTEKLELIIEKAADRIREKRYKQTEAARAKGKISKETENAKTIGSIAATATAKTSPAAKKSGPVPVESSVDAAIKQVGGSAFR